MFIIVEINENGIVGVTTHDKLSNAKQDLDERVESEIEDLKYWHPDIEEDFDRYVSITRNEDSARIEYYENGGMEITRLFEYAIFVI